MRKNIELMESAIKSNNHLLIAKLKLEEGWTDEEIEDLRRRHFDKVISDMNKRGRILSFNQIVDLIGKENYYGD